MAKTNNEDGELLQIVLYGQRDKQSIAYRDPCNWDETREILARDIFALANTCGGHLVIGVEDIPDLLYYRGLTKAQAESFTDASVNAFLQSCVLPEIITTVYKPKLAGKTFVVITVPGFTDEPYVCRVNARDVLCEGDIYVRTNAWRSNSVTVSCDRDQSAGLFLHRADFLEW